MENFNKQPHIVLIGRDINSIETSYFTGATTKFYFKEPIDAFYNCFYFYMGLNVEYSAKCHHVWYFLQVAIFKVIFDDQPKIPTIEETFLEFQTNV